MFSHGVIDLHCDTLTVSMDSNQPPNTLDNPAAKLTLSNLPQQVRWAQCYAIFVPDGLSQAQAVDFYNQHRDNFLRQSQLYAHRMSVCRTATDIENAWTQGKTAALLTIENGSALAGDLNRVKILAQDGVRAITLTWNGENEIASGNTSDHGLSDFGRAVIPAMEEQGILVDVSHLNDRGFYEMLDVVKKPFVATHSNARAICGHMRNLTDDQIRQMVQRNCLVGLNYYNIFLRNDGTLATLEDVYEQVNHFLELGAQDCLALGSDFDGADLPPCLDSPTKAAGMYQYFLDRGLDAKLCEKIMYKNALSFFQQAWSE